MKDNKKNLIGLYSGIQKQLEIKNKLIQEQELYTIGTEKYKELALKIELITGNIAMLNAIIQQYLVKLE